MGKLAQCGTDSFHKFLSVRIFLGQINSIRSFYHTMLYTVDSFIVDISLILGTGSGLIYGQPMRNGS